jgi:MerR family transcriptional regulator, redox-sensitive transcriptional activator SoxR
MSGSLVPIDKIAKRSGFSASALRYYERCGLIIQGVKIGGRRHYPSSIVQRLAVVRVCQSIGFTLSEISQLLDCAPSREGTWREMAMARRTQVEQQIKELEHVLELIDATIDCACLKLSDCPQMGPNSHLSRLLPLPAPYSWSIDFRDGSGSCQGGSC